MVNINEEQDLGEHQTTPRCCHKRERELHKLLPIIKVYKEDRLHKYTKGQSKTERDFWSMKKPDLKHLEPRHRQPGEREREAYRLDTPNETNKWFSKGLQ